MEQYLLYDAKAGTIIVRLALCLKEEIRMNDVCSAVLFTIDYLNCKVFFVLYLCVILF